MSENTCKHCIEVQKQTKYITFQKMSVTVKAYMYDMYVSLNAIEHRSVIFILYSD